MAGERDSPEPTDCQDVGTGHAEPPREAPRPEPDPRQVRHQPRRPAERHRHRPDRRRLDRRRVRDRGRHERRGGRRAVVGAAAADGIMMEGGTGHGRLSMTEAPVAPVNNGVVHPRRGLARLPDSARASWASNHVRSHLRSRRRGADVTASRSMSGTNLFARTPGRRS